MADFMKPFSAQTYGLLRIVAGLMFLSHGAQKLLSWPVEAMQSAPAFVT